MVVHYNPALWRGQRVSAGWCTISQSWGGESRGSVQGGALYPVEGGTEGQDKFKASLFYKMTPKSDSALIKTNKKKNKGNHFREIKGDKDHVI